MEVGALGCVKNADFEKKKKKEKKKEKKKRKCK